MVHLIDSKLCQRVIGIVREPEVEYVKQDSAPCAGEDMYPLYIAQPQEQVVENDEDQCCEGCD